MAIYFLEKLRLNEEEKKNFDKEKLKLTQKVDPSLIGGIKIALDDKVYDASLKTKLNDLKKHLLGGTLNEN